MGKTQRIIGLLFAVCCLKNDGL